MKMKISFVRGAYLNNFEGQNYQLPITGYSSLFPIDANVPFPLIKLPSISDLQRISFLNQSIKYIANRTLGDSQILFGLETYIRGSDIVHVGDPHYYYSYQAAQLKANKKIKKLVSTWWETIPYNNESVAAKKTIKKYTMNNVDMFICYTEKAKKCLMAEGISADKITIISLGVDLTLFKPLQNKKNDGFTILFVGRLVDEKGILDLYRSFKQIANENKKVYLRIVGAGPLENMLQNLIQKDNLQRWVTIERRKYKEMPKIFQNASVVCVPSKKTKTWEEQYGMVFIEAMACAVPIISFDTGVIKDVVGSAGIIVPENDIKSLVASLTRLMKDKELAEKLGTIGRERAKRLYDARITATKLSEMYKSL